MGKKSRRPNRNKPKRGEMEVFLAELDLPIPLAVDAATPARDNRELADYCLENLPHFEKQDELRFSVFGAYVNVLADVIAEDGEMAENAENEWIKRHYKVLRRIENDETDLAFFRANALSCLAYRYCAHTIDYEATIDCHEKILVLCENASEVEKSRRMRSGKLVGQKLSEMQRRSKQLIEQGYKKFTVSVFRSPTETVQLAWSAGNQCDNCQKTKAELNVDRFSCCTRCQFEYYCSKECQRSAYKNGHKQRCRAPGQFLVGDQARFCSRRNYGSSYNERVQLLEKVEREDSWVVVGLCGKNQRRVPTQKLRRLRPALWNCPEAYQPDAKSWMRDAELNPRKL